MKPLIVLVLNSYILIASMKAQSYFALSIGKDCAQYRELKDPGPGRQFYVDDEGYSKRSTVYTISGEKNLSKRVSLNSNLSFTKKDLDDADLEALIAIRGIRLNSFRSMLSLKYHPTTAYWYAGSGLVLHYLSDVRSYDIYGNESPVYIETRKKFGAVIYAGGSYKNFFLEPYFIKGFWTFKRSKAVDFRPINSFGVSLGYRIRVSKKK